MCGRFGLGNPERLDGFLYRHSFPGVPAVAPRFNITPSADIPIVLTVERDAITAAARWGLVPSWANDANIGARLVQARGETAHEKPAYRRALKSRRGLIPADLFYEWQAVAGQKLQQPWCIRLRNEETFAMGALWEYWPTSINGEGAPQFSCCIVTTASNHTLKHVHERMPLIIAETDYDAWLNVDTNADDVRSLIQPFPHDRLYAYKVSTWVNSPGHDDARCIAPIDESAADAIDETQNAPASKTSLKTNRADSGQIDAFG